jgi:integrase/recombinase XerD
MTKKFEVLKAVNSADIIDQELADKFKQAANKKHTVQDFIDEFLGQFLSDQTKRAYLNDLNNFFNFLKTGDVIITHPNEICSHHFQFYRDDLIAKDLASATINRKLVAIRSFIKWSMALKLIDHNPLDVVKLPKVQTKTPTLAFTDQEVVSMINATDMQTKTGRSHRLLMTLLFSLGLRRSEVANITLKDIYEERGHYVISILGKGGKYRHLPLSETLISEIHHYINYINENHFELIAEDYLIQSAPKGKNSKPIDGSTIYRVIERYAKACGITKKVSPHSCRATAISHLLDTHQVPIRDVAIFAGHSKITTTERYDKRRDDLNKSAAYKIDYKKKSA